MFCLCSDNLLWVHCTFTVLYLVIALAFMRHFAVSLRYEVRDEQVKLPCVIPSVLLRPSALTFKLLFLGLKNADDY